MNAKQLKLIAVLLGVAVLLYLPRVFGGGSGEGSLDVGDGFELTAPGDVTGVDIIEADGTTRRLALEDNAWTIDGYRTDTPKVDDLLASLETVSSSDLVARNPSNHGSMGVQDDGRRIEIRTTQGGPYVFHLGERDSRAGGYFVRLPGEDFVYRLSGSVGGFLTRERDGWRPRQIASVDTTTIQEIVLRRDASETVVRRDAGGWMAGDAVADSAAMTNLLSMLPTLSLSGFPTDAEAAAADFTLANGALDVFASDQGDVLGRRLVFSLRLIEDAERGDWLIRVSDDDEVLRLAQFSVDRLLPAALLPQ